MCAFVCVCDIVFVCVVCDSVCRVVCLVLHVFFCVFGGGSFVDLKVYACAVCDVLCVVCGACASIVYVCSVRN